MSFGAGVYFDGVTSARREVAVELGADSLQISAGDGNLSIQWPCNEIEELDAPPASFGSGDAAARHWSVWKFGTRHLRPRSMSAPSTSIALARRSNTNAFALSDGRWGRPHRFCWWPGSGYRRLRHA